MDDFKLDGHKMYAHLDRVVRWEQDGGMNVFPLYVEISPVSFCNHRCSFCAMDYLGYKHHTLDLSKLRYTLGSMAFNGVSSVMYAGEGEPLLHKGINEIIESTKSLGMDVAITTNGTLMDEDFCRKSLAKCSWIKISCNAGDWITYSKVHGVQAAEFGILWENIEYAVAYRKAHGIDTTIGVQAVALPENMETLDALAQMCKETGVDYLVIKPYSQHKKSINKQDTDEEYKRLYEKHVRPLSKYSCSTFELISRDRALEGCVEQDRKKQYSKCLSVPFFWAYIMATGDVYGCSAFLGDPRFCYGNINLDSFYNIWMSTERAKAIKFMREDFDISDCRQSCRMHCVNTFLHKVANPGKHKNFI